MKYENSRKFFKQALEIICNYLNIHTPINIWSEMKIDIDSVNAPDEWALNICKALNANTYFNPIGGLSFFNKEKYIKNGIDIKFIKSRKILYPQLSENFSPFLSIIDIMMFNSPERIREMLDDYELE